jgi:hypothetical protein
MGRGIIGQRVDGRLDRLEMSSMVGLADKQSAMGTALKRIRGDPLAGFVCFCRSSTIAESFREEAQGKKSRRWPHFGYCLDGETIAQSSWWETVPS